MKKLLIGILASSLSIAAFASTENLLNAVAESEELCRLDDCNEGKEIVKALKIELSKTKLSCNGLLRAAIQGGSYRQALLDRSTSILSYNQQNNVISIATGLLETDYSIFVLDFELSADFKKIKSLGGFQVRKDTQAVNNGTILNPQIEMQTTERKTHETHCSVQY